MSLQLSAAHSFSLLTSILSYEYTASGLHMPLVIDMGYVQFGAIMNKTANEDSLLEV